MPSEMRKLFCLLLFLIHIAVSACECPPVPMITKELTDEYDVIFLGRIDSVSACEHGISNAFFSISELYKGAVSKNVRVSFDCASSCMMSLSKEEDWLIYGIFERFDQLSIKFCGHSRKKFLRPEEDMYVATAQRPFETEKEFLKSTLGIHPFTEKEQINEQAELRPHNTQPGGMNKLWLLLGGLGAMLIVYFIAKKIKK